MLKTDQFDRKWVNLIFLSKEFINFSRIANMSTELVLVTYQTIKNFTFDFWVLKITNSDDVEQYWFKVDEIVKFLKCDKNLEDIKEIISSKFLQTWDELKPYTVETFEKPNLWLPNTLFLAEVGLTSLVVKSSIDADEMKKFTEWIFAYALPAFRQKTAEQAKEKLNATTRELEIAHQKIEEFNTAMIECNRNMSFASQVCDSARRDTVTVTMKILDVFHDVVESHTKANLAIASVHDQLKNSMKQVVRGQVNAAVRRAIKRQRKDNDSNDRN